MRTAARRSLLLNSHPTPLGPAMNTSWFQQVHSPRQRLLCPLTSRWCTGCSGQQLRSTRSSSRLHSVTIAVLLRFQYRLFPAAATSWRTHQACEGRRPKRPSPLLRHPTFRFRTAQWYRYSQSGTPQRSSEEVRPSQQVLLLVVLTSLAQKHQPREESPCWCLGTPRRYR